MIDIEQKLSRGFSDDETWSLDMTIARFIVPRLERFKELNNGHPSTLLPESWDAIIQEMIDGFKEAAKDDLNSDTVKIDRALELFKEWFQALWW